MMPENGEKRIRVNSEFFSELTLITNGMGFVIMNFVRLIAPNVGMVVGAYCDTPLQKMDLQDFLCV